MLPEYGDRATCKTCGNAIRFNGTYWEHVGASLRHPPTVNYERPYYRNDHCVEWTIKVQAG